VTDAGQPARPPARPRLPSVVATGRGDDGTTGLLFGGERIRKDDPRTEAYGTIDEAVAALGVARAELGRDDSPRSRSDGRSAMPDVGELLLRLQRELFVVGAELATAAADRERLQADVSRVTEAMVDRLESTLAELEARMTMPREFVVPGQTPFSAALEVARTVVRRAERRAVGLVRNGSVESAWLLAYLNRLADLLWVMARVAEHASDTSAPPSRG
jgi:cob(I)alamin adenosyltransferase